MMNISKSIQKVSFLLLVICSALLAKAKITKSSTIAMVGSHQITTDEFVKRLSDYLFLTNIKDNILVRHSIINNMINEILLRDHDDNSSITNNPEYQKEIKWADRQTVLAYLEDQEVYAKITASDEEIRTAYFRANEKIAARHLFAQTEKEAQTLYQLVQTGVEFNQLATQVFIDTTLRNNGGYLGYFSWGDMDPAFEDTAYSLKVGQISKPVKTKYGYSIIKLEDRVQHPLLTENEYLNKREHMAGVVRLRKKEQAEKEFIKKHFDSDKVIFNENSIKDIWNKLNPTLHNSIENNAADTRKANCVKYGKKSYTQEQIEKRLDEIPEFHRDKLNTIDNLKTAIKGILLNEILYNIAVSKGYDTCKAITNLIKNYRTSIFLEFKRRETFDQTILPDTSILKFYSENQNRFQEPNRISIQEIIVNTKVLADTIITMLSNGQDFGALAKKYSMRDWSARNSGIIGPDDVSKFGMLKDTLWNSEIGKVIGPIKIQDLYGVFKVTEKQKGIITPFENVKVEAHRLAKIEKSKQIMDDYINRIKPKVNIKVDEGLIASVPISN